MKGFDDRIDANEKKISGELLSRQKETDVALAQAKSESHESFRAVQARIDTFLTLIFTVVAVLFAALGIIATKSGSNEPTFLNPPVWVAAIALFFALQSYVQVEGGRPPGRWYSRMVPLGLAIVITGVIVLASLYFHGYQDFSAKEIRQTKDQASKASSAIDEEKKEREAQSRANDSRLETLQQQVNLLLRNQAAKK